MPGLGVLQPGALLPPIRGAHGTGAGGGDGGWWGGGAGAVADDQAVDRAEAAPEADVQGEDWEWGHGGPGRPVGSRGRGDLRGAPLGRSRFVHVERRVPELPV